MLESQEEDDSDYEESAEQQNQLGVSYSLVLKTKNFIASYILYVYTVVTSYIVNYISCTFI